MMSSKKLLGLKYLVIYHRITGSTYFNYCKNNILIKLILIIYSIINLTNIIILFYGTLSSFKSYKLKNSKKLQLIYLLYTSGSIGYLAQVILIYLFLIFRGKKILDFLQNQDFIKTNPKFERRIGLKMIFIQFLWK